MFTAYAPIRTASEALIVSNMRGIEMVPNIIYSQSESIYFSIPDNQWHFCDCFDTGNDYKISQGEAYHNVWESVTIVILPALRKFNGEGYIYQETDWYKSFMLDWNFGDKLMPFLAYEHGMDYQTQYLDKLSDGEESN